MNYEVQNEITRNYFKKDFTQLNELIKRIRQCLVSGEKISLEGLELDDVLDYNPKENFLFVSIFQPMTRKIRFGSKRDTLEETLDRIVAKLRANERFKDFEVNDPEKTRLLVEWINKKQPTVISKVHCDGEFDEYRFEPGITGLQLVYNNNTHIWLPTDSPVLNEMTLGPVLLYLAERTGITKDKNYSKGEKMRALKNLEGAEFFLIESHAFVTYKNDILPLYRGNVLYKDFDYKTVLDIFTTSNDHLVKNMSDNGQFMYYYNPTLDNNIDHEHPAHKAPNLYYNDLRHCGGAVSLLRMWELTKDNKYLDCVRSAIKWTISMTKFHEDKEGREAAYVYANKKAKLGGVGLPLIMLMRYRTDTNDQSFDRYIEAYVRHLLMRITDDGEFMGYYIHPSYHNGEPLIEMTDEERRATFSFYYPGEALMGLGMFVNRYGNKNPELAQEVIRKARVAMNWIVEDRPKLYAEQFAPLPSDSWLMQAIEEWSYCKGFLERNAIDFVFTDARAMMERMYLRDDSPYIDFEGGMYYHMGDHYYPDGARCEGLIAAYYLAKKLEMFELADEILASAKKAAKCQFQLYISEFNNYAHRNPAKSQGSIKFKSTRQWIRVDSIQHVACFFIRLYWAENKTTAPNFITRKPIGVL